MARASKFRFILSFFAALLLSTHASANPVNLASFAKYFGRFLSKQLDNCSTCHVSAKFEKLPSSLAEFPHNPFGHRLAVLGEKLRQEEKKADIPTRLRMIAADDSDGDGVDNLSELLLGHMPGDPNDKPSVSELALLAGKKVEFAAFRASYRWEPFETVKRPAVPRVINTAWVRNPIDAFVASEHEAKNLVPRPPASKDVLLRRIYLDLIGLNPTPDQIRAFENDKSPNAYEKVVDKLLAIPQYGERWGRHWMDVWRYSDWAGWADGNQIRDSKPHIWRWRDWIVESLNKDKGYDRMAQEMLAADELCPEDTDTLRATGFLVRNFKLLSREQWMEDTLNHTSRAFLGLTMHCAKCHNHMYDPVTQNEYYRLRAIFEPHDVRTDRIPGQPDTAKDGLVRTYDKDLKVATYFYPRGDERHPIKDQILTPGIPLALGGTYHADLVKLPPLAHDPDKRDFVIKEEIAKSEGAIAYAVNALREVGPAPSEKKTLWELNLDVIQARHTSLLSVLKVEKLEDAGDKSSDAWKQAAMGAQLTQRRQALLEARLNFMNAQRAVVDTRLASEAAMKGMDKTVLTKSAEAYRNAGAKAAEAEKALTKAEADSKLPITTAFTPRKIESFPSESTGRRLAFARWLTDMRNPLFARVAANHIWARHFAEGIVPSLSDFGRNGRQPTNPKLLDWLACELMKPGIQVFRYSGIQDGRSGSAVLPEHPNTRTPEHPSAWSMKHLHRLIVTSNTYRMASTPDTMDAKADPDDVFLWRYPYKRMEAEVVRDNMLWVSGQLDLALGGPDIDQNLGLTSKRRSIYLRIAAEKEVEFLKIFDGPSVTECYRRNQSVMPQQALALSNSELAIAQAKIVAKDLSARSGLDTSRFIQEAFLRILCRRPTPAEVKLCQVFLRNQPEPKPEANGVTTASVTAGQSPKLEDTLALRGRENLVRVLFNHNDFVTVR